MTQGCCILALAQRCSSACGPKTPETANLQMHPAQNLACNLVIYTTGLMPGRASLQTESLSLWAASQVVPSCSCCMLQLPSNRRQTFQ